MRNKGFFWFITILLTGICVYQLSFTWVSNNVEKKAEKEANALVAELKAEAMKTDGIGYLPNNTTVDFTIPLGHNVSSVLVILDGLILPPVDTVLVEQH